MSLVNNTKSLLESKFQEQKTVEQVIFSNLEEGVDFVTVEAQSQDQSSRKILKKAGAERLVAAFGYRVVFDVLDDVLNPSGVATITAKASLFKEDDVKLCESFGAAFSGFYDFDRNTSIKVAQNRALIGAVITSLGIARIFSEEYSDENSEVARVDSAKLIDEVRALAEKAGVTEVDILKRYGVERLEDVHQEQLVVTKKMLTTRLANDSKSTPKPVKTTEKPASTKNKSKDSKASA